MSTSRLSKSIQNAKVALIFYFLNLVLQFFSRKIFLDYLGSEVLGLNTMAQNFLGFLNIVELGIVSAVTYNLYKPVYEGDKQAINEIVSIQGWLYRRVAYVVIVGACILMCFFPLIFEKANLPLWYAYTTFIALLLSALLWYFFNYKMILLSADQKEYKITYCTQGIKIVKVLLQMWAVMSLFNGYVYWIVLEVLMTIVSSVVLSRVIKREYPWLCSVSVDGKTLQRKYREIIRKTKQVFFHKIANLVLLQTSPLIIYAYASLTLVTIYGNYMMIVSAVTTLMGALLSGINAGIGNLVAEGNREKIKSVFWQLTTLRMWLASIICFGIYMFGHSFVKLWVGDGFQMPQSAFVVLLVITFIQLTRVDAFISAYGLYQDIWAPVIEVLLNLSLSILLGYYYGLAGILAGVLISLVVIVEIWKPYFLYQCGFNDNVWEYVLFFSKKIFLLFLCFALLVWFSEFTVNLVSDTYLHWCINLVKLLFEYIIISFLFLYCLDASLRNIAKRFFGMWMAHFKRKS